MNVLVTGAAGLVGGAVVDALVRRGVGVIAMVHKDPVIKANDGRVLPTHKFNASPPGRGEIKTIKAEITQAGLGLRTAELKQLQGTIDCVIHCAALVRFEAAFEDLRAVNIEGTCRVAECFPNARIVHVSTAYTCGLQNGPIAEVLHQSAGPFSNGYERSKAIAERALLDFRPDAIIARPSIVVGESVSGQIRNFDTIYQAFKIIAEGRIAALPVADDATLNFVPIDHVVEGIIALASGPKPSELNMAKSATIAHLTAREAVGAQKFLKLIGQVPGLHCPQMTSIQTDQAPSHSRLEGILRPYFSYFTRSPQFLTQRFEQATGLASPDIDDAALLSHIQYCVDTGFIRTCAPAI